MSPRASCPHPPFRLSALFTALVLVVVSVSVYGQESVPPPEAGERDSAPAPALGHRAVTALDVFYACRSLEAFRPTALRDFCKLGVPRGGSAFTATVIARSGEAVPDSLHIRRFAEEVRTRVTRARGREAAIGMVLGPDLTDGQLEGEDASRWANVVEMVASHITELQPDSVWIIWQAGRENQGASAQRVTEELARYAASIGATVPVIKARAEAGDRRGVITVHAWVPLIPYREIATLEAIRFAEGSAVPDEVLLSTAAEEIQQHPAYRERGALVEVVGYADGGVEPNDLAHRRAAALRSGLVTNGIEPARIRPRVGAGAAPRLPDASPGLGGIGRFNIHGVAANAPSASVFHERQGRQTAGVSGWQGIAMAATDAIVDRAEREVQAYVFIAFGHQLCAGDRRAALLATCALVPNDGQRQYVPGFTTLRAAIRSDLTGLPEHMLAASFDRRRRFIAEIPGRLDEIALAKALLASEGTAEEAVDRAHVALRRVSIRAARPRDAELARQALRELENRYREDQRAFASFARGALGSLFAIDMTRRVSRGDDVITVLSDVANWLERRDPALQRPWDHFASVHRFSEFLRLNIETAGELRRVTNGAVPQDTVLRYAVLTLIANSGAIADPERQQSIAWLVDSVHEVQRAVADLRNVNAQLDALPMSSDSAARARRELYARALARMVDVGTIPFTAGEGTPNLSPPLAASHRDIPISVAESLSGLLVAIQTERHTDVLTQTLGLINTFTPSRWLTDDTASTAHLRLFTLAADLATAQSETDMREAMNRFVNQAGTAVGKRTGQGIGLHLNAHVGVGKATVPNDSAYATGLRVPVGFEVVWRRVAPQFMPSLLFQVIDLGGFVPRINDPTDRTADERVASILTPGVFAIVPVHTSPFTLGAGVTLPLRADGEHWSGGLAWGVFAGVDVPVLRLR